MRYVAVQEAVKQAESKMGTARKALAMLREKAKAEEKMKEKERAA